MPPTVNTERRILRATCTDAPGLVAKITGLCAEHGLNIIENAEFVDSERGRFFMRTEVEGDFGDEAEDTIMAALQASLPEDAALRLIKTGKKPVVVMVTKESHCLGDLLVQTFDDRLPIRIEAVLSNREELRSLVERFDVPFEHIPTEGLSREAHEAQVLERLAVYKPRYVILAKYMRILTPAFVARYAGRLINIHHSFLPAFVGARPYHQAYERGVKLVGATAHFVTEVLDEGPIITQGVTPVNHRYGPQDMAMAGRDVEMSTLNRALRLVLAERVFINQNRTVTL